MDKNGVGLLKVWKQQLMQLKNVSQDVAQAIIAEYPSPQLLVQVVSIIPLPIPQFNGPEEEAF